MRKQPAFNLPINPRYGYPCLSWSDVASIESNVSAWLDRQIGLAKKMESMAMDFGTFVHLQIKHKKIKDIPHGNNPEKILIYKTKKFTIVGKPDDYNDEIIHEYKSAKDLWTRREAETHGQLFTYGLLTWKTDGKFRKQAQLISLETKYDDDIDDLVLTGKKRVITVPIKMIDVLKIQVRFEKAYNKAIKEIKRREVGQGDDD